MKRLLLVLSLTFFPLFCFSATEGTDIGFVTSVPSADPVGSSGSINIEGFALASEFTSPADATTVTDIGWWIDADSSGHVDTDTEAGIYDDDMDSPDVLLFSDTSLGSNPDDDWKDYSGQNWAVNGSTKYWLAIQSDGVAAGTIECDRQTGEGGNQYYYDSSELTLPNPWVSASNTSKVYCIYARYTTAAPSGAPQVILISQVYNPIFGCNVLGF